MTNLSGANLNNGAAVGPQGEGRESPSNFSTYPAYKDSGVEWMGEVPAHWNVAPVGMYYEMRNGFPFSADNFSPEGAPEHRLIRIRDILGNDSPLYTDESCPAQCIVENGDILIGMDGDFNIASWAEGKAKLNQRVCAIRGSSFSWDRFFFYGIGAPLKIINDLTFATTVKHLASSQVLKTRFPIPPETEVDNIARFLGHETARIDALIAEQQRLIELLKEKRQAVISHAVTKGLDPTVPMKDSGVEWLGEVPAHWEVKQLKHVVDPNSSITYGIVQAGPEFEGGVPYIRTSDMSGEELPVSGYPLTSPDIDESYARSRVRPGDIVMSIRASVGKCLPVPDELKVANLTQGTAKISAGKSITRNFLLAFLNAGATQNYFDLMAKGATFKEITLDALRRTPVLLPPANEQIEIDQFVARHAELWDEICKQAIQSVSLLQERRSALISAAVTGKIDVRGWQPPVSTQAPESAVAEAN